MNKSVSRITVAASSSSRSAVRMNGAIREEFPNVVWIHSHVAVEDDGRVRTFCLYEAPDLDAIQAHAELLGQHTIDGVFEVAGDVTPADFPPVTEEA